MRDRDTPGVVGSLNCSSYVQQTLWEDGGRVSTNRQPRTTCTGHTGKPRAPSHRATTEAPALKPNPTSWHGAQDRRRWALLLAHATARRCSHRRTQHDANTAHSRPSLRSLPTPSLAVRTGSRCNQQQPRDLCYKNHACDAGRYTQHTHACNTTCTFSLGP